MMSPHRFTVLVGIDFSEPSDRALDRALEVAGLRQVSEVHVLHVEPEALLQGALSTPAADAQSAEAAVEEVRRRALERVEAMTGEPGKLHIQRVVAHVRRGDAAEGIAALAAEIDADLIVVGACPGDRRRALARVPVEDRIARLAPCPVYIMRPRDHAPSVPPPMSSRLCRDCLAVRRETGGARYWCRAHGANGGAYTYSSAGVSSAETISYESAPAHPHG